MHRAAQDTRVNRDEFTAYDIIKTAAEQIIDTAYKDVFGQN